MSEVTDVGTDAASDSAPYPGLRYYLPSQASLFAARDEDVDQCFEKYVNSRILILHGTTGCGKSSFLRAGLKPKLEKTHGRTFAEDQGEMQVVRSGPDPLRSMATHVYREIKRCETAYRADDEMHGGLVSPVIEDVLKLYPTEASFLALIEDKPRAFVEILRRFEAAVEDPPAIVVDQAEEVFTLNITENSLQDRELSTEEAFLRTEPYFAFLAAFAETSIETKIVISLRTEYKGQFDDRLAAHSTIDRPRIRGFHLPDLDRKGMIDAIRKPTRDWGFEFEDGVPEEIVKRLMKEIPPGGRLPVLQVACLRLWTRARDQQSQKTLASQDEVRGKLLIRRIDVSLLGSFGSQIRDYLRDRLREMGRIYQKDYNKLVERTDSEAADIGLRASKWMGFFHQHLVDLQADGRTTTKKLSHKIMQSELTKSFSESFVRFGDPSLSPEEVIGRTEQPEERSELDWLACDRVGVLRKQYGPDETYWMLGHDSIGLVLERWHQTSGAAMRSMMMMDMNMPRQAANSSDQYFPSEERPDVKKVYIPEDLLWDRYLLQFAQKKGITTQIGLEFIVKPELRALEPGQEVGISWTELLSRLESTRVGNADGYPVLFICERNNIVTGDDSAPDIARNWHDIAIADEFTGNALVGPPNIKGAQPLRSLGLAEEEQRRKDNVAQLKGIFDFLTRTRSRIICYDQSAKAALLLAGRMAGVPEATLDSLNVDTESSWNLKYSSRDFLFAEMWAKNEQALAEGREERTFIMGSDYGRAVAEQAGFETYFSRQDLLWLRQSQERASDDAAKIDANVVTHAVWNLGYPDGQPRDIDLEYRIASVAFCVAEHVRTSAEEFVEFVYDRHDDLWARNNGFPISQEIVRNVIRDCFNFYHFEHYGRLWYQRDSSQRYWVEDEEKFHANKSRPIYFRMQDLRARCTQLFKDFEDKLKSSYVTVESKASAVEYSKHAWNNFVVFNFHDSVRLIQQAIETLEGYGTRFDAK